MTTKLSEHCNVIIGGDEEETSGKHKNGSHNIFSKIHYNRIAESLSICLSNTLLAVEPNAAGETLTKFFNIFVIYISTHLAKLKVKNV